MENQYTKYAEILSKLKQVNIWIAVIIALVIITLIAITIKLKDTKLTWLALISGFVIIAILYATSIMPYSKDINENAYTTYEGKFYLEEIQFINRGGTYIYIKLPNEAESKRYKASSNLEFQFPATYYGRIVTSDNSNILLEIITTNND